MVKVPAFEGEHEAALPVRAGEDLDPLTETSWGSKFFGLSHLPPFPLATEFVPACWDWERHRFLGSPLCPGLGNLTPSPTAPRAGDGHTVNLEQWGGAVLQACPEG